MRILYSNVIEQNAGWGAEYFVNRGLIKLGHATFCIDYRQHRNNLYQRFIQVPPCDIFFLQRGDYFPLQLLRSIMLPRFFWASELVSRCRDQDRLFKSGLFKHIFLRTRACIETIVERGWVKDENCSVLLSGFDETVFRPSTNATKEIDVLFVGSLTTRRKELLDKISEFFRVHVASAFGEEMTDLINRSRIVLNIHAEDYPDIETRVFEVLGCGGFLLTEKLSPENPFAENELVQFESLEDCLDKISFYLKEQDLRESIAGSGYQSSVQEHTYTVRAREIIEIISPYVQSNIMIGKNLSELPMRIYGLEEFARKTLKSPYRKVRGLLSQ